MSISCFIQQHKNDRMKTIGSENVLNAYEWHKKQNRKKNNDRMKNTIQEFQRMHNTQAK